MSYNQYPSLNSGEIHMQIGTQAPSYGMGQRPTSQTDHLITELLSDVEFMNGCEGLCSEEEGVPKGKRKVAPPKKKFPIKEENQHLFMKTGPPWGVSGRKGLAANPRTGPPRGRALAFGLRLPKGESARLLIRSGQDKARPWDPSAPRVQPHEPEPVEGEEVWESSPGHGRPGPRQKDIEDAAVAQAQTTPASRAARASGAGAVGVRACPSQRPWVDRKGEA